MKEKVYHLHVKSGHFLVPAELSVGGRAHSLPISETERFYLPERGLEFIGTLHLLPATIDLEELAEGKMKPTVQLTKETLEGPTSLWSVYKLKEIPSNTTLLKVEKKKIDRVMDAYKECRKADKEFGKEISDYMKKHPDLPQSFDYKPKIDPFEYYDKLYLECEKTFIPLINMTDVTSTQSDSQNQILLIRHL